jgi:S-adenosylmethionine hydrolase
MAARRPVISLLTDFGLQDHFVGTMKGVILSINPDAEIIDISHNIPPHDIFQAAFLLKSSCPYFPAHTIHVVVVDPGVGTSRRPIIVSTSGERGYFIAPDNGVLSYLYAEGDIGEVREITADHYFLKPRSGTFDGRDVFAPVAAWLSKGVSVSSFGEPITAYKQFEVPEPILMQPDVLRCNVIYIDRFGNLVSNLSRQRFEEHLKTSQNRQCGFRLGQQNVSKICNSYAEGQQGELMAIFGSSGFLEFSVNQGNASKLTEVGIGGNILFKVV